MGRLKRAREEAADAFCRLLSRHGIRAWTRHWHTLGVAVEGVPEAHELTLRVAWTQGSPPPPRKLREALRAWQPVLTYLHPAIITRDDKTIRPKDRERIARWLWWRALHNARLVADAPPESWAEVALPTDEE